MNLDIYVFLTLLVLGYVFGRIAERKHFKSIIEREYKYKELLTFNGKFAPPDIGKVDSQLVSGNVVISVDYFKRVAAGLRTIVGGRVTTYESLLERARREAILRMKERAKLIGANMIINVKLETASISKGAKQQIGCVEVIAYGTALIPVDRHYR